MELKNCQRGGNHSNKRNQGEQGMRGLAEELKL